MTTDLLPRCSFLAVLLTAGHLIAAEPPPVLPDLTKDNSQVDRNGTYNLGATGLRGWIHTKPATRIDSMQGRTTAASRQILVTHVGVKSPADGLVKVDDVIVGVEGKPFADDARKVMAMAIQNAEKESSGGKLRLSMVRAGQALEVALPLAVMGTYSPTAPWDCPKSQRILEAACKALEQEPLTEHWAGPIQGLALLATGKKEYLPMLRDYARKLAPANLKLGLTHDASSWILGYRNLFLCEYYLITKDEEVLHGIREHTRVLVLGQGMYGSYGHGLTPLRADGSPNGPVPAYGPVNMTGLSANLSIVLGKMCGVTGRDVDQAIERAARFFAYFTDKGAVPYGEHQPWPFHENNGKNSLGAVLFAAMGDRTHDAQFFARMATAGHANREGGHTGQGFSYLWGALGASVGGPEAAAAFFREASWHFDLVRRSDGTFTYDGAEQYGPGKTDDNTYFGKSGYYGLSPNACYVLTYSLPLKNLVITGRGLDPKATLDKDAVAESITAGYFDLEREKMSAPELVRAFSSWSPIVRAWAAQELATRPEAKSMVAELVALAGGNDPHIIQGACETLGLLNTPEALPVLVQQLSHPDRWVRYKAAEAIKTMGNTAKPVLPDLLKALADTAEPLWPIQWHDPVQIAHGQLAAAVFSGPLKESLKDADPRLLYPAVRAVSLNPDGMARAPLRHFFEKRATLEDVVALAPDILAAVENPSPADTMFNNQIRMGAFKALTRFRFEEGIEAGVNYAFTQGSHGSRIRTGEIMREIIPYGTAAQPYIPRLRELIAMFNKEADDKIFPSHPNNTERVAALEEAIRAIEAATEAPEMRRLSDHATARATIESVHAIGTMGKGERVLQGEEEAVLFEHRGKGCLSHFWFGGNFEGVEDTRIRYYIDGETVPSIDMNLYMGHGIGFNDNHAPWATKHIGKIGKRNGIYNNYRIPFGKSVRVSAQRAPKAAENPQIWWIIRGMENGRVSLGGMELPESARLKLIRRENHEAQSLEEFDLCNVEGRGALYKVAIAAQGGSLTYLEACIRAYRGKSNTPLMLSSGLEDYFLGTYYFDTGKFHADMAGMTHFDRKAGSFSAYRFHDEDPVVFQNGLRLTCRCGETEHGTADGKAYLNPTKTRYTTYTWVYQW